MKVPIVLLRSVEWCLLALVVLAFAIVADLVTIAEIGWSRFARRFLGRPAPAAPPAQSGYGCR